jgi:chitinase
MPHIRYTITTALPAGEWALQHLNLFQVAQYVDFVNLMAYDFTGPWTPKSGHHAQLHCPNDPDSGPSCDRAIKYMYKQGIPMQKIILGIPVYGRSFLMATAEGDSYTGHGGDEGTFEFKDLPRPGTTEQVDDEACAAYCVGGDGGFVTYDNPHTVRIKAIHAKRKGLAGLFYWTATGDASGDRSLVYNGYSELHNTT